MPEDPLKRIFVSDKNSLILVGSLFDIFLKAFVSPPDKKRLLYVFASTGWSESIPSKFFKSIDEDIAVETLSCL